jgi:hypothetical protein
MSAAMESTATTTTVKTAPHIAMEPSAAHAAVESTTTAYMDTAPESGMKTSSETSVKSATEGSSKADADSRIKSKTHPRITVIGIMGVIRIGIIIRIISVIQTRIPIASPNVHHR